MSIFRDVEGVLCRNRLIDETQLLSARGHVRRWGRPLEQAVVDLGFVAESLLYAHLAAAVALPFVRIEDREVPRAVLRRIPERLVRSRGVLPFELGDAARGPLLVAMPDPLNLPLLDELAFAAGMKVRGVVAGPSDIEQAIARHFTPTVAV